MKPPLISTIIACLLMLINWSCKKESNFNFGPDFSFEYIDSNMVKFSNESTGNYIYANWDFGNGDVKSTIDKNKTFEIYYPEKGSYKVTLELSDEMLNRDTISKFIDIEKSDLVVSFTASIDNKDPNMVHLVNTSLGSFDSFKWKFRSKEVENENEFAAWFPYSGKQEIELEILKNNKKYISKTSVNIAQDDPDYFNKLELSWSDEFEGPNVDPSSWTFETGASGWGNNELQDYTNGANAEIADGILILSAVKVNDNQEPGSYTSTRIITKNKRIFTYGRMEIRAKLPSGRGIWPAIWMLGNNNSSLIWPACGEIDIMEYVGYEPNRIYSTVHTTSGWGADGSGSSKILTTAEEEFHIYGVLWTEKKMIFYTDTPSNITHIYDPSIKNDDTWPFYLPQFFVLNVAVGGNWGGAQGIDDSIFPQSMEIDYVRVYQEP